MINFIVEATTIFESNPKFFIKSMGISIILKDNNYHKAGFIDKYNMDETAEIIDFIFKNIEEMEIDILDIDRTFIRLVVCPYSQYTLNNE